MEEIAQFLKIQRIMRPLYRQLYSEIKWTAWTNSQRNAIFKTEPENRNLNGPIASEKCAVIRTHLPANKSEIQTAT